MDDEYESFTKFCRNQRAAEPQRSIIFTEDWHVEIPRSKLARAATYQHPTHIVRAMTLDEVKVPGFDTTTGIPYSRCRKPRNTRSIGSTITQWAHPMYIGPLMQNEAFPYHPNRSNGGYTMVDPDNVFDGQVRVMTKTTWDASENHFAKMPAGAPPFLTMECDFKWRGYLVRFYDGDLYFTALSKDSYIEGISATGYFCVDCDVLTEGNAPGAVNVFEFTPWE